MVVRSDNLQKGNIQLLLDRRFISKGILPNVEGIIVGLSVLYFLILLSIYIRFVSIRTLTGRITIDMFRLMTR